MQQKAKRIIDEIQKVVIGKEEIIQKILMAILANGHILLEDIPGVGKTTLAVSFSQAMQLQMCIRDRPPAAAPARFSGYPHLIFLPTRIFPVPVNQAGDQNASGW